MNQTCPHPTAAPAGVDPEAGVWMLHKAPGVTVSLNDSGTHDSIFRCFDGLHLAGIAPIGRLDPASEGLMLFGIISDWRARLHPRVQQVLKTYQVSIDRPADAALTARLVRGVTDHGDFLNAHAARSLESAPRESWLEITLCESRNRHVRRLLTAFGLRPLRCRRVALGDLSLGSLACGQVRPLTTAELRSLLG